MSYKNKQCQRQSSLFLLLKRPIQSIRWFTNTSSTPHTTAQRPKIFTEKMHRGSRFLVSKVVMKELLTAIKDFVAKRSRNTSVTLSEKKRNSSFASWYSRSHSGSSSSFDPYSASSWRHKLTSLGFASGELRSTADRLLLCCVEHDGIKGVVTGVRPVPPSMRESKLNGIPLVGVVIGIPVTSIELFIKDGVSTVLKANVSGLSLGSAYNDREFSLLLLSNPTGSELGLFGLVAAIMALPAFVGSTNWSSGRFGFITGFTSGGDVDRSRQTALWASNSSSNSSFSCCRLWISSVRLCFFSSKSLVSYKNHTR